MRDALLLIFISYFSDGLDEDVYQWYHHHNIGTRKNKFQIYLCVKRHKDPYVNVIMML